MEWEPVIGLEVHVQLNTKSKIFSGASTKYGAPPNTQACLVDLGMPGVLPVLNHSAVKMAVQFGMAINATINKKSVFARKNYFYPDLPKGYQISQFDLPIVSNGNIDINVDDRTKTIGVTRAHLEEDAGKSIHDLFDDYTAIDLNRAGTPLLEVVSEPEMHSSKEAIAYLKQLYGVVTHLEICDGNMQEGSFRIDVNISMKPKGSKKLGTRAEIKNINSFKFVEQAIKYEAIRQIKLLEEGKKVTQETRLFDSAKNETRSMRSKEEAHDYRYFPDPDLLPLIIKDEEIDKIKQEMPELPKEKQQRFQDIYSLNKYDASILVNDKNLSNFFEETAKHTTADYKTIANWLLSEFLSYINKYDIPVSNSPITAKMFANLLNKITDNTINGKIAKTVFDKMWQTKKSAETIIEEEDLKQVSDDVALNNIISSIIADNPENVAAYLAGKDKLFGFFVGQVMKASKGKANPAQVNNLLKEYFEKNT